MKLVIGLMFAGLCVASTPTGTAAFVKLDATSQGNWKSSYGTDGYLVIGDSANFPSYVSMTYSGNSSYTWTTSTTDARALQTASGRTAACWFTATTMYYELNFSDTSAHQVALYMLDWDNYLGGRTQTVDITDAAGNSLDSARLISGFSNGAYLVWNLSGHVFIRITNTSTKANAVSSGIFFGPAPAVVVPPPPPPPASIRSLGNCPPFPSDNFWNVPANTWPNDYNSDGYIKTISGYRVGSVPSMYINYATNSTPVPALKVASSLESDVGPFPITPQMQVEGYGSSNCSVATGGCIPGSDNHVLVINTDTCDLWEGYGLSSSAPPYVFGSVAHWNLKSDRLRTDYTLPLFSGDSMGLTSADAAGLPITPGILTHAEAYGSAPITHAIRFTLPQAAANQAFVWPATHFSANNSNINGLPFGARLVLSPTWDSTTCHNSDYSGSSFSSYPAIQRIITAMQTYGIVFADIGLGIGLTADSDPLWGNANAAGSDTWVLNGWLHCILGSAFQVKRMSPTVSITSGAAK
jgi:hypothetical protein